jgi:acyl-CoA synthetase (NDP forming)
MNDDYLWDKSGEPDPEVQILEQLLGTLRYQEKPLELPEQITPSRSTNHVFLLAIAATILMALVAAGLWLKARHNRVPQDQLATAPKSPSTPEPVKDAASPDKPKVVNPSTADNRETERKPHFARVKLPTKPALSPKEQDEALAAKQQLLLALRLASEKLNEVQRRALGPTTPIKNQHKVG